MSKSAAFTDLRNKIEEVAYSGLDGGLTPSLCYAVRSVFGPHPEWLTDVIQEEAAWPGGSRRHGWWVNAHIARFSSSYEEAVAAWKQWAHGRVSCMEASDIKISEGIFAVSELFSTEIEKPLDYEEYKLFGQKSLERVTKLAKKELDTPMVNLKNLQCLLYDALLDFSSTWGEDYPIHSHVSNDFGVEWLRVNTFDAVHYPVGVPQHMALKCHADWQVFARNRLRGFKAQAIALTSLRVKMRVE